MGEWTALYRYRAARRSGARTGIDPTAQKLKANQIHSSKRGCPTGYRTEGPDGVDPMADRMNACQIYGSKSWCWTEGPDGVTGGKIYGRKSRCRGGGRTGVARTNKGLNGMPDGCLTGCRIGGRMGCPTGPDGVPDGSHVIGHIIFECHVICLGWQGVILLPTLLSQR
jgi:hypothetical protein